MSKSELVRYYEERYENLAREQRTARNCFVKNLVEELIQVVVDRMPSSIRLYENLSKQAMWLRYLGLGVAGLPAVMGAVMFLLTGRPEPLIILPPTAIIPILTVYMPARRMTNEYRRCVRELLVLEGKFASLQVGQNDMMN
jgi:hypothetical protein